MPTKRTMDAVASRTRPAGPARLGEVVAERYELSEWIGRGRNGVVFRARDRVLRRDVAVKLLYPDLADDAGTLAAFHDDARLAARINHPNVVAVYDTGEHEGQPFVVTEWVAGETLAARLERGPRPKSEARAIGVQLCRALAAAHALGLIHRDVRPANVLLTADGAVKLRDFGVPKVGDQPEDTTGVVVSEALGYVAPERLAGAPASCASDMYSAGAVLFETLTGRAPASADTAEELLAKLQRVGDGNGDPRLAFATVIARAMTKNPRYRFPTAAVMADAIERTNPARRPAPLAAPSETPPIVVEPTAVGPAPAPRHRARRAAAVVLASGVFGVAAFVGVARGNEGDHPAPTTAPPSTAPTTAPVTAPPATAAPTTTTTSTTTTTTSSSTTTISTTTTTTRPTTTTSTTTTSATTTTSKARGRRGRSG